MLNFIAVTFDWIVIFLLFMFLTDSTITMQNSTYELVISVTTIKKFVSTTFHKIFSNK